jgi:hypothetical protein
MNVKNIHQQTANAAANIYIQVPDRRRCHQFGYCRANPTNLRTRLAERGRSGTT